ncbi:PBS lyase HEAT-like repeat protein [Thioploca ingrica]|uniref:PBS lyase HEAT-like repeat protein n=1 Tax=Thioploca ingrica TaxID=40754 RepID=A0A090AH08_9GAMM|nr:PBS lyase HEAT-like repeat protein [Thioploca ingrica]
MITSKSLQANHWPTFITRLQQEDIATQNQALELFETLPPKLAFAAISQLPPLLVANETRHKTLQLLRTIVPLWSKPDTFPGLAQIEAILSDPQEELANRFIALKILGKLGLETTAASVIGLIEPTAEYTENLFALDVYAALGNIPGSLSLEFLTERLAKLDQAKQQWRHQRDQTEASVKSTTTDPCQSSNISDDKGKWLYPQAEFELGYAIARRDPRKSGIELLEHNLARVRNGAWVALGEIKDVELLKTLIQQRADNPDKPHFRHAAYRAIDNMLITFEYKGNKADLADLSKIKDLVKDPATQDRMQWTIYQLKYRCEWLKSCEKP